ncbi:MAG: PQQ-dependent sugar dehydrogenase [Candidatus Limnocylindria bacterium]
MPGATTTYTMRFRNAGSETWQRGVSGRQVNLGINGDDRSQSDALSVGWPSPDRVAIQAEASVAPGAIATFTFGVRAPATPGRYALHLRPVADGREWLEDQGVFLVVNSDHGFHSAWVSQSPYPTLAPGATSAPYTITFRNTGTRAWRKGVAGEQANLGINGDDRSFSAYAVSWPTPDRVAIQNEATVAPGATGSFTFQFKAPPTPGRYALHLRPVVDGATWMEDQGVFLFITVSGGTAGPPTLAATVVQSGLRIPWDVAFAPDGRMFVTERVGNILVYASGAPNAPQLSNTAVANVRAEGEAGLMSITLDPAFATNGLVYVCASVSDGGQWLNQVLRYRMSGDVPAFDGYVIRAGMRANTRHDGCRIRFGPDGKLWVTMGDSGSSSLAQDPSSLNGKVLRVNGDGSIPSDNPIMPGASGRGAVYTMGNRNPQGLAFEPGTGRAFLADHGEATHDEINILVAGGNYGWPIAQGPDGPGGYLDPAWSSGGSTIATSGADFVSGAQWGAWSGSLLVATLKEQDLRRFTVAGATAAAAEILYDNVYGRLRTARLAPDGSLYLTTSNGSGDRVIRITAAQ